MTGYLITGHGQYASGLLSAARMLMGGLEDWHAIDFLTGDSAETLEETIRTTLAGQEDVVDAPPAGPEETIAAPPAGHLPDYGEWVILTDLLGGTPFNVAVKIALGQPGIRVVTGVNLPFVLTLAFAEPPEPGSAGPAGTGANPGSNFGSASNSGPGSASDPIGKCLEEAREAFFEVDLTAGQSLTK